MMLATNKSEPACVASHSSAKNTVEKIRSNLSAAMNMSIIPEKFEGGQMKFLERVLLENRFSSTFQVKKFDCFLKVVSKGVLFGMYVACRANVYSKSGNKIT